MFIILVEDKNWLMMIRHLRPGEGRIAVNRSKSRHSAISGSKPIYIHRPLLMAPLYAVIR